MFFKQLKELKKLRFQFIDIHSYSLFYVPSTNNMCFKTLPIHLRFEEGILMTREWKYASF